MVSPSRNMRTVSGFRSRDCNFRREEAPQDAQSPGSYASENATLRSRVPTASQISMWRCERSLPSRIAMLIIPLASLIASLRAAPKSVRSVPSSSLMMFVRVKMWKKNLGIDRLSRNVPTSVRTCAGW